jgi:hypothetical protein
MRVKIVTPDGTDDMETLVDMEWSGPLPEVAIISIVPTATRGLRGTRS